MDEQNVTLRVENVTKRYGEFTAVEDLSFNIHAGKVFGFWVRTEQEKRQRFG